ncbi:MAG: RDD family protein [Halarcobacter sp.]
MAKWRDVKNKKQKNKPLQEEDKTSCASLGSRLKAFLTDSFLITTPILYIVIYFIMGSGAEFAENRLSGWAMILATHSIIIILFWAIKQQTPGMKAYKLKLVTSKLEKVTIIHILIRYITTLIALVSIFLLFIPFFNKEKKTFQDILSNTILINEE